MATPSEDEILVGHYLKIWDSYGTPPGHYRPDAAAQILSFIRSGREERRLASFLAIVDGDIAGSASCQLHQSPFPEVIQPEQRLHGYIWSVYVADAFRRRGIALKLTNKAVDYLKSIGCTTAVIHASDAGEHVYLAAGFELAKEMRLKFSAE
ncbi:ribosomal protein S18 acetylase RimI-like enzyme [Rhizobium leguminosarum]|uniref:Ribosomal protein S18 acetylase RimI-like enzyme n=2 Tax=Rhizobium/Agrobacterium group TaxID=227290 RepID=A0AAE2MR12_RHILE|nr:ribosomal protein S18 acetylase RimI-like enzyme [Rhizobium leguminosarum]MBB4435837.1 ribosomal protein S18 acetylase RimI-like enzyme [Rhizobium esperanzae]MBB4300212.1 ribosomal protein S18 acetylase RimI-like enzyme [Rhizobium leguminosarum]MBB4311483.1 ribosomal protein S18 acetylase RimI-like enzyme [Rhizobium leguminosarum]MBB4420498.1 ribosomal protein S18 acetylase RimI-like enzyme [Rhizobium leguminosarum]